MNTGWADRMISDVCLVTDYVANGSFASLRENVHYIDNDGYAILVRLADSTRRWKGPFKYVSKHAFDFLSKSSLRPGDLIMSNVGEPGKVFVVPNLGKPMTLGPNSVLIRSHGNETSNQFLFYYFSSEVGRAQIDDISEGVAQKKFNKTAFRSLRIPLPTLPEQLRIVGILDEAFANIATAKANAAQNLQNARALFESHLQSVFTQRGPGWVETTLGAATEGVFTGPFGSLLHKSDYVENGIPLVNPAHITETGIEPDFRKSVARQTATRLESYIMRQGDIVIGRRGEMGRCALVTKTEDGWLCGTGSFFIKPSNRCDPGYLVRFLRSEGCRRRLQKLAGGAVMPNLTNTALADFPMALPPLKQQKVIVEQIDELAEETQRLARLYERKLAALEALKKSLLHQAFSGEL